MEHKSTGVAAACSVSQVLIFSNDDLIVVHATLIYRNCVLLLLNQIRYFIIIRIYKLHSSLIKSTDVFVAIIFLISSSVFGNVNTSELAISTTGLSKKEKILAEIEALKHLHGNQLPPYKYRLCAEMIVRKPKIYS